MKLINNMKVEEINSLVLAYVGDCVYENYIRHYLISKGIANVNDLQKEAIKYVSATAQSNAIHKLIDDNFLHDDEISIFNRVRNNKGHGHPKSCDIVTYKNATGLEGLIGYLDLSSNHERIKEIMKYIVGE